MASVLASALAAHQSQRIRCWFRLSAGFVMRSTHAFVRMASSSALFAQGTGEVTAGVLQDGLLVRDLQLPLGHKYAFLLRPLPTRAQVRLLVLQVPPLTHAHQLVSGSAAALKG